MELTEIHAEQQSNVSTKIARKMRMKKRMIAAAIVIILLLTGFFVTWFIAGAHATQKASEENQKLTDTIVELQQQIRELLENPIVVTPVAPEINLDVIYSEINDIGELATVEYLFTDAAKFSDSKQIKNWNIPLTEKSFLMKWDGVIKAGINVEGISIKVKEADKKLIVTMPKAEILSYSIDNDSVEVLDEKDNLFNKISIEDKVKFDTATEEAMKERAIENNILEKAQKNAEEIIKRLLMANPSIGTMYTIEFVIGD